MRQDDVAEDDRRVRAADGRSSPARGRRRLQRAAARAQREHRLPAVRPVPAHVRVRQRGVRPPGEEGRGETRPAGGRWRCSRSCGSPSSPRRRPAQMSGGQQQRVALARALVNLPSALLLDEPLAALDLKLREAMQIELKRIQREVGITFVFVTHDQGEALTMSDRIAVMSRGKVEQIGTPEEIYAKPASIFVAGFIGSANLLPGTLDSVDDGRARVRLDNGTVVETIGATLAQAGDPVTVMLRPERLQPACRWRGRRPGRVWRRAAGDLPRVRAAPARRSQRRHRGGRHGRAGRRHGVAATRRADRSGLGAGRAVPAARPLGDRRCHDDRRRRGAGRRWRARRSSPSRATPRRRRSADSAGGR